HAVHATAWPGKHDRRDLLGSLAISFWSARLPLRISATLYRRLANDQLFRLSRAEHDSVIFSRLQRQALSLSPTCLLWRTCDHALPAHQTRQGDDSCCRSCLNRHAMKIKRVLKWAVATILLALVGWLFIAYWLSTNECFRNASAPTNPMKAIVHCEYGSPDVLELKDVQKPIPNDNQVLVKVRAIAVNPLDL